MTKKIAILLTMLVIGTVTVSAESFAGAEKMGEKMLNTFMQRGTYVKVIDSERHIIFYIPKSSLLYIAINEDGIKIKLDGDSVYSGTPISLDKDCNLILKTSLPNYEFTLKKTTYPWE